MELSGKVPAVRRWELWTVAGAMLLVGLLTIPFLSKHGFWCDEVFSVTAARTWSGLMEVFAKYENNMALYFVLLHGWMTLGEDEATVRLLSVLFAMAAIPVVHVLTRRLFDLRVALIADVMLACNAMFLRHAQEARSYSLLLLLTACSSALFIRGLQQPTWGVWVGYAVTVAAAVYAHYFGILIACAQVAACLLWRGRPNIPWRHVLTAAGLTMVLLLPELLFRPASHTQVDELLTPVPAELLGLLMQFCGGRTLTLVYVGCLLLAMWTWWRGHDAQGVRPRWHIWFLVVWAVAPVAVVFIFSVLVKPIFVPKYLLGCLPALIILAALGLSRLRTWMVIITLVALVGMLVVNLQRRGLSTSEPWRELVAQMAAEARPGDLVVCYPYYIRLPVTHYLGRQRGPGADLVFADFASGPYHPGGGAVDPVPDMGRLAEQVQAHARVWCFFLQGGEARLNREWRPAIEALISQHHPHREITSHPPQLTWFAYDMVLFSDTAVPPGGE